MRRRWIFFVPLAIAGFVAFIIAGGVVVQFLWNWLLPALFGWPQLTFWQALGLLALCRILFGGFGRHCSPRSRLRRRLEERLDHMSPEERERFKRGMRSRWDFGSPAPENKEV
jgi:hypothetical protein